MIDTINWPRQVLGGVRCLTQKFGTSLLAAYTRYRVGMRNKEEDITQRRRVRRGKKRFLVFFFPDP